MKHDETCIYNPYALDDPEIDVVTYGHDAGNEKLGHFHSKEQQQADYEFVEQIEELQGEEDLLENEYSPEDHFDDEPTEEIDLDTHNEPIEDHHSDGNGYDKWEYNG
jgi:LPS O-antigen subunit length determinant protein (WzzB/FepE family)